MKFKNSWGNTGYKGINAVYETREGFKFELQFHTSASHSAKEGGTHALYGRQRLLPERSPEWMDLENQQNAIFDAVQVPPGALNLWGE